MESFEERNEIPEEEDEDEDDDDAEEEFYAYTKPEEPDWPIPETIDPSTPDYLTANFFSASEKIGQRFNDHDIALFMGLSGTNPFVSWRDHVHNQRTGNKYHWAISSHSHEDRHQELDPDFHLMGEVERQHMDKIKTRNFRRGAVVRFDTGGQPVFPKHFF